jgi:APA family basic amino acid/polyamine antiporter
MTATSDPLGERLVPQMGLFDSTMIVMGGVVGVGIFMNPYVVAQHLHSSALILGAWIAGGIVALFGAFIYAELGARLPKAGGEYVYLREGIHPAVGFFYGWVALIVINAGGCAAVAATFAQYLRTVVPLPFSDRTVGILTIVVLTVINSMGVKAGSKVQSGLMLLRGAAVVMLVFCGAWWLGRSGINPTGASRPLHEQQLSFDLAAAFGAALIPVFFAYGGWQTANFVAAEVREPKKNLPRALVLGMGGVIVLYVAVNMICVRVLGATDLAATSTPAWSAMRRVAGDRGAELLTVGIVLSALGFLSQSVLTYPRVSYAMAADGLLPAAIARLDGRSRAPVVAIVLNSVLAIAVLAVGRYEQILTYVESMDLLFFGLTAITLFVFRRREKLGTQTREDPLTSSTFRVPGHPWTTLVFIAVCFLVVLNTLFRNHGNTLIIGVVLSVGAVFYVVRQRRILQKSDRDET